jgi:hypothetical protein
MKYQPFEWLQLQAEYDGVNNAITASQTQVYRHDKSFNVT